MQRRFISNALLCATTWVGEESDRVLDIRYVDVDEKLFSELNCIYRITRGIHKISKGNTRQEGIKSAMYSLFWRRTQPNFVQHLLWSHPWVTNPCFWWWIFTVDLKYSLQDIFCSFLCTRHKYLIFIFILLVKHSFQTLMRTTKIYFVKIYFT